MILACVQVALSESHHVTQGSVESPRKVSTYVVEQKWYWSDGESDLPKVSSGIRS
jgi:hypothetical protein